MGRVRIGVDGRHISVSQVTKLRAHLGEGFILVHPPQNLMDLVWVDKPPRPRETIYGPLTGSSGILASCHLGVFLLS